MQYNAMQTYNDETKVDVCYHINYYGSPLKYYPR